MSADCMVMRSAVWIYLDDDLWALAPDEKAAIDV